MNKQRRVLRALGYSLAAVLLLHLLVFAGGAFMVAFPNPAKVRQDYGRIEDSFPDAKRLTGPGDVAGVLLPNPSSTGVVVMCHGRSRRMEQLLPLALQLAPQWNVFLFDFRSHGERGYGPTSIGWNEADDLAAVLDFLAPRFPDGIAVFGESMGAAAAVYELSRHPRPEVKALVADGCYEDITPVILAEGDRLGFAPYMSAVSLRLAGLVGSFPPEKLRPVDFAPALKLPVLFTQAESDALVPPGAAAHLAAATGANGLLATYPGGHDEPANPALQKLVAAFLKKFSQPVTEETLGTKQ